MPTNPPSSSHTPCPLERHHFQGRWGFVSRGTLIFTFAAALTAPPIHAQVLSPGKLSAPHSELGGLRNCTDCHDLKKAGTVNDRCLACHEPLASRIQRNAGYHATVRERNCASCHREHLGSDNALVQLDTAAFDHGETGYVLAASHREVECRNCHAADLIAAEDVRAFKSEHDALERTLLGLPQTCAACHERDDPHAGQLQGHACDECHDETDWTDAARFDHSRTRYRLAGGHRRVDCGRCHKKARVARGGITIRFRPLEFGRCDGCHRDAHEGGLGANCSECHSTAGWHRVASSSVETRFDHEATEFPLFGKHRELECEACHGRRPAWTDELRMRYRRGTEGYAYPRPVAESCTSCHVDYHRGVFSNSVGGIACDNCHAEEAWIPGRYDIPRHNEEASYALEGAHLTVPCIDCHPTPNPGLEEKQFRLASAACVDCHQADDPHGQQFGNRRCSECHDVRSFQVFDFDHSRSSYPLDGKHRRTLCASCHPLEAGPGGKPLRRYKPLGSECRDCHTETEDG